MSKFGHISSMKDLNTEITELEIKRQIIKNELVLRTKLAKEDLTPTAVGWEALSIFLSKDKSNKLVSALIKTVVKMIATKEASKYGLKLLKKIFS